jgi:hypothetical protein
MPSDGDPEARTGTVEPSAPVTRMSWQMVAMLAGLVSMGVGAVTWTVSTSRASGASEALVASSVATNSTEIARNSGAIEKLECLPERLARVEVQLEQQAKSLERIELAVGSSRRKVD